MAADSPENFRLTLLNPGGHDREQQFHSAPAPGEGPHPPINFHAFAASTFAAFHRDVHRALAENTPVLLLLSSDFRASERALAELKRQRRVVAVSLKETGLHQIAQQLRDSGIYPNTLPDRGSTMGFFCAAQRAVRHFRWHTRMGRAIAQSFRCAIGRTGAVRSD